MYLKAKMSKYNLFRSNTQVVVLARENLILLFFGALSILYGLVISHTSYWKYILCVCLLILICLIFIRLNRIVSSKTWLSSKISPEKKSVLITGCDTGFGYLTAKRLSQKGFQVFAGCLGPPPEDLTKDPNVVCLQMNVSKEEEVQLAREAVQRHLQEDHDLWAVINNAGISKGSELQVTDMQKIESVLDVNLLGTIRTTKAFLPLLQKARGRVVNIASAAGRFPMPGFVPYAVSKRGVIAFSDGLRLEMDKHGVAVVSVEPWMYRTRLADPAAVARHIQRQWAHSVSPDQRRQMSHDDYVARLSQKTSGLFSNAANPNVDEVVDVLEAAVTNACPRFVYRPGKWYLNAALCVAGFAPQPLVDYVLGDLVFGC